MSNTSSDHQSTIHPTLIQLTQQLDAMHIAQLASLAYGLPPLFLCKTYLDEPEESAIEKCLQRLENGINQQAFSLEKLTELLTERDFYDDYEARLRLGPEPQ